MQKSKPFKLKEALEGKPMHACDLLGNKFKIKVMQIAGFKYLPIGVFRCSVELKHNVGAIIDFSQNGISECGNYKLFMSTEDEKTMKHKKFDLQKAIAGEPIVYIHNGTIYEAKFLSYDEKAKKMHISVSVKFEDDTCSDGLTVHNWEIRHLNKNGSGVNNKMFLFMAEQEPEQKEEPEFFFNIYHDDKHIYKHATYNDAIRFLNKNSDLIGTFSSKSAINPEKKKYWMAIRGNLNFSYSIQFKHFTTNLYESKEILLANIDINDFDKIIEVYI